MMPDQHKVGRWARIEISGEVYLPRRGIEFHWLLLAVQRFLENHKSSMIIILECFFVLRAN